MHQNRFWLIFLLTIAICTVVYTLYSFYQLYQYDRLDRQIPIQKIEWSIIEESKEKFIPKANFQYSFQGNTYSGQTLWDEYYLNASTAQEAIDRLYSNQLQLKTWIDSSNPHISTLQKNFPLKQCIYMFFLWILTIYFYGLGRYVNSLGSRSR
ncbi:MAG: hypothetical protein H0W88_08600 [Parachlamydiaceae bacterium]|nr:hypothetical protein [Parachlamydiaceae bacterium]